MRSVLFARTLMGGQDLDYGFETPHTEGGPSPVQLTCNAEWASHVWRLLLTVIAGADPCKASSPGPVYPGRASIGGSGRPMLTC
ncbi:hypothetical protein KUCAC02_028996 [Chaenocephalus aceratus]|uniref:Uncharacterized protein n=1 Tax=Chaenocephalus aceratus TaxID=36190 RepID=A0ACB9X5J2_CHAAC|nr:hypothetical protein KUCAC02_028996 [Chaenocephalus aceratus]